MFNLGQLVIHNNRREWGIGKITGVTHEFYRIAWTNREESNFKKKIIEPLLRQCQSSEEFKSYSPPNKSRKKTKVPRREGSGQLCRVCQKLLNKSQFKSNRRWKSCPKCSTENGDVHIYFEYPKYFGQTNARVNQNNFDGAQSYCKKCRGNLIGHFPSQNCDSFK